MTKAASVYQPSNVYPSFVVAGDCSMTDTVMSPTTVPPSVSNCTVYLFFSHFAYSVCAFVTSYGNVTRLTKAASVYQPSNVYPSRVVTGDCSMTDTIISLTYVPPSVSKRTVYLFFSHFA